MSSPAIPRFVLVAAMVGLLPFAAGGPSSGATIGLPITRNYALDEIGDVSRGVRLGFDRLGRLAVMGDDSYVVLNDATWLDIAEKGDDLPSLVRVVTDAQGISYFGSLAAWGTAEYTKEGRLRPHNQRPAQCPDWVAGTGFVHVLPQAAGVYFAGLEGVVYWDRATGEQVFFHVPGTTTIFALGSRVLVSSHGKGTQYLDVEHHSVEPVEGGQVADLTIEHAIGLGEDRELIATLTGRLLVFDGKTVAPWHGPLADEPSGRVSGLRRLSDGDIAIAVDGRGLFIVSEHGDIRLALTSPEYHRIHDLAAREPGVLWISTEEMVQKLLYGSPVTIVDRRAGVPIGWPQIVQWSDRTVISSSGRLYETVPAADGLSVRFESMAGQPQNGAWAIAASGSQLLVGNRDGLYVRAGDTFAPVLSDIDPSKLVMVSPDLCYVIGATEITALRWIDGRWSECAPRVPGVGFPSVVHAAPTSAWIELGANRVARVSLSDGQLHTRVFDRYPWTETRWVNVGIVGDIVALSGGAAGALFFDERTGDFCEAPELRRLIESAPFPITRITQDARGTLWASHEKGVLVMRPNPASGSGNPFEGSFQKILREHQPRVQIAGLDDVWISTGRTLYHVTRRSTETPPAPLQPSLISVTDRRTGTEFFPEPGPAKPALDLPYSRNSLSFRFFSGTYSGIRPPLYEFSMSGGLSEWTTRSTDSLLTLHDLNEGTYHLRARLVDTIGRSAEPVDVDFSIAAPWHRSPLAYAGYGAAAILSGSGLFFLAVRRTRKKSAFLAHLVRERTEELRSTMARLNEETRNAATLAERNRLAGEIHDSLQQGLSGLMLQLDATLKLPDLASDVRSKLTVARNMVSFTRQEVQQAVWDLESPLLENADLAEALKRMAGLISSGAPQVEIKTSGTATAVSSSTQHQLLRIAQEAITNAVRHGNARKIFVHLEYAKTGISLEIFDDGRGFVPENVFANGIGHFGLRGLRGRASTINADLQIISAPNRGTTVRIEIPLVHDAAPAHAIVASV